MIINFSIAILASVIYISSVLTHNSFFAISTIVLSISIQVIFIFCI
ncbi:hypothetical protein HOF65_01705 [bacterium]|nr:hypothetical protein [bacterium]MBT3852732.1 hypothetical protein [bacterium]MBT4633616.1 hypothetical protein [bacterium]